MYGCMDGGSGSGGSKNSRKSRNQALTDQHSMSGSQRIGALMKRVGEEIGKGNRYVFSNHQIALGSIFKNLVKWQQDF